MKTLLVTVSLALAGAASVNAQVFRPSVGGGAVVGAVAGGLIGGHNGDRWAEGAVIGAAAGALIGAVLERPEPAYRVRGTTAIVPVATVPCAPTVGYAEPVQVVRAPQVVYVERAPTVVYVPAPAPVVIVRPPAVAYGYGYRPVVRAPAYCPPPPPRSHHRHGHYGR